MSHAVFKELEDLRRMLETPHRSSNQELGSSQSSQLAAASANATRSPGEQPKLYETVLRGAEKGVSRLSRAIDVADEEMDAALKRTEEVHRIAGERRELEIAELRKVIAAKERSIDGLRDTLSGVKRTLETRVHQLEDALLLREQDLATRNQEVEALRDEMAAWKEELAGWREERQMIKVHNSQLTQQAEALVREHAQIQEDLQCAIRQNQSTIKALRHDKEEVLEKCNEFKRQAQQAAESAKVEAEARARLAESVRGQNEEIEHLLATVQLLKNKLRAERKVRKASEKWLRAELKSREDMEALFATVRDIALSNNISDDETERVKELVENLRLDRDAATRIEAVSRTARAGGGRGDPCGGRGRLEARAGAHGTLDINGQLASAKRMLSEQLLSHGELRRRSPYR